MTSNYSFDEDKETKQERILLEKVNQVLLGKTEELESVKKELEEKLFSQVHKTKEMEQERILLNQLNSIMEKNLETKPSSNDSPNQLVYRLLEIHKEMSLLRLSEFSKIGQFEVLGYLEELESKDMIVRLDPRKEMVCRDCPSTNLELSLRCPNCKSSTYAKCKLIEHYSCGNVSPEDEYASDECPKCRKKIKAHGLDFRATDCYVCDKCADKFQEPLFILKCNNCSATFKNENANWKESPRFKLK